MGNSNTNQEAIAHVIEEFIKSGSCVLNNKGQILNLPHHFSYEAHRYLIQDGRLNPDHLLNAALAIDIKQDNSVNNIDHKEKLIKLAFEHKANPNNISSLSNLSEESLTLLLENGFEAQKILQHALSMYIGRHYNPDGKLVIDTSATEKREKLINFALEKGAKLQNITYLSNDLAYETYEYLLKKGLKADVLLGTAINIETFKLEVQHY